MAAVPEYGHPIGALCRHHSLNREHHRINKMPSRKVDPLTLGSRDSVHRYFLSVAIILCNKMDFSFGASMAAFAEPVTH